MAKLLLRRQIALLRERLNATVIANKQCLDTKISDYLVLALVTGEDKRFWNHGGVDLAAICRASYHVIVNRQLQGASTIEQQLVRTLTKYRKLSLRRKLREIFLAAAINDFISKREIASLYLCCAYYGWRMNSLSEACRRLAISKETMSLEQAAELIARLKYPEPQFAPMQRQALITNRALYIIDKIPRNLL